MPKSNDALTGGVLATAAYGRGIEEIGVGAFSLGACGQALAAVTRRSPAAVIVAQAAWLVRERRRTRAARQQVLMVLESMTDEFISAMEDEDDYDDEDEEFEEYDEEDEEGEFDEEDEEEMMDEEDMEDEETVSRDGNMPPR